MAAESALSGWADDDGPAGGVLADDGSEAALGESDCFVADLVTLGGMNIRVQRGRWGRVKKRVAGR